MKPRRHELLRDALAILETRGATDIRHRIGGRHIKLSAIYHGIPIRATMSITPSDWRARRESRALLRRLLRTVDQGALRAGRQSRTGNGGSQ